MSLRSLSSSSKSFANPSLSSTSSVKLACSSFWSNMLDVHHLNWIRGDGVKEEGNKTEDKLWRDKKIRRWSFRRTSLHFWRLMTCSLHFSSCSSPPSLDFLLILWLLLNFLLGALYLSLNPQEWTFGVSWIQTGSYVRKERDRVQSTSTLLLLSSILYFVPFTSIKIGWVKQFIEASSLENFEQTAFQLICWPFISFKRLQVV